MNDDIIRMARETGKTQWYGTHRDGTSDFLIAEFTLEQLKRFAELVRADEREACAKVCDERAKLWPDEGGDAGTCAIYIRERGKT